MLVLCSCNLCVAGEHGKRLVFGLAAAVALSRKASALVVSMEGLRAEQRSTRLLMGRKTAEVAEIEVQVQEAETDVKR